MKFGIEIEMSRLILSLVLETESKSSSRNVRSWNQNQNHLLDVHRLGTGIGTKKLEPGTSDSNDAC